ncbi:MAG: putative thymidylate synthase [Prokaryotic dsDNA virus sp.]|jgi:thymidylate synthase|nr:MAG: putative thymidylate synthase [Prokaryotic dsDNA virus sp.]|tara:strand:- start:31202 stop:32254 length:1053 start_codon:yes stop_codon:yes gene_type:complete
MKFIEVPNVGEALAYMGATLQEWGIPRDSRNGEVFVADGPVTTMYHYPTQRVIFDPARDANPFFHFMEGLWMIAGRNDVAWPVQFNSTFGQFSDDGETFHGAYGYRWINHFSEQIDVIEPNEEIDEIKLQGKVWAPMNQLAHVVEMLKANPDERRALVTMWSPEDDLGYKGKDVPCNLSILFSISVHGKLDMTVTNRSNDMIWGAYGANAVHMSMLQEYMAAWIGVPVGRYWQVSNNFHVYTKTMDKVTPTLEYQDPYLSEVKPFPMVNTDIESWGMDLSLFMEVGPVPNFQDKFFRKVASPMWETWFTWKDASGGRTKSQRALAALDVAKNIAASDWRKACTEWLERRV